MTDNIKTGGNGRRIAPLDSEMKAEHSSNS